MEQYTDKIINGESFVVLKTLPDAFIDSCITSPPYWGLRNYENDLQIGNEKHFSEFVDRLCNIFDEIKRVLKPEGTCFVNLGDTYNGFKQGNTSNKGYVENTVIDTFTKQKTELPNKCLCMIPERFAIEMISRGWTLRNQIVWHKPNQMPQSATDRFTVDFEKIFFFVKNEKYYFEQQLEPYQSKPQPPINKNKQNCNNGMDVDRFSYGARDYYSKGSRNTRTVWSINTEPNSDAHFACYPQKLVERMLKAGCPEGGLVLDPFFGSGTTGIYAKKSGRNYLGIELNSEYISIAEKRLYKEIGMFL